MKKKEINYRFKYFLKNDTLAYIESVLTKEAKDRWEVVSISSQLGLGMLVLLKKLYDSQP